VFNVCDRSSCPFRLWFIVGVSLMWRRTHLPSILEYWKNLVAMTSWRSRLQTVLPAGARSYSMWTVNSESGKLHAVLIQDSTESFWEKRLPFEGVESSLQYLPRCVHPQMDGGHEQWLQLPKILKDEGVDVYEVTDIVAKALKGATLKEKKAIIKEIWAGFPAAPKPEELKLEHLIYGYPEAPYYDAKQDRVILPDFRRVAWPYSRDTSFTTQVGTVICNMRRYSRRHEVRVVKLAYELDPTLSKHVEVVWDANEEGGVVKTTGSRAVALLARGMTVAEARERVYADASAVKGKLFYRRDIATGI